MNLFGELQNKQSKPQQMRSEVKASELRIGNLMLFGNIEAKILEIRQGQDLNLLRLNYFRDDIECFHRPLVETNQISGIPLAEEWHNKFGVIKNGFHSFEYKLPRINNISLTVIFDGDYVWIRQGDQTKPIPQHDMITVWNKDLTKRDMYVHEWQNLYHLLTGTELTLTTPNQ